MIGWAVRTLGFLPAIHWPQVHRASQVYLNDSSELLKTKVPSSSSGNVAKVEIDLAGICELKLIGRTLTVSVTNPAATRRFVGYECVLNHVVFLLSARVLRESGCVKGGTN